MEAPPTNLKPFSFLELVKRTFRIYRENFLTIIGLVAFVTIPISLITIIISPQPFTALTASTTSLSETPDMSQFFLNLISLVKAILITAPLTYLVSEYLFNHKLTIGEAFSGVSHRFTQIGCGVLLIGFGMGLLGVFIMVLVIAFPPALVASGLLIHVIIATSALMFPVLTLENIGPSAAFSRSWSLGKRHFWAAFGIGLISILIALLVGGVLGGIITLAITTTAPNMNLNVQLLLISLISEIVGIFIAPISPIAFTILYYDIRNITEGLDTQLSSGVPPAGRPINLVSPVSRFQFDNHDWRNIAILSVIGLIVGIIGNNLIQQFIQQFAPGLR